MTDPGYRSKARAIGHGFVFLDRVRLMVNERILENDISIFSLTERTGEARITLIHSSVQKR